MKCHACGRRRRCRHVPGTRLMQGPACDAAVPTQLSAAPHDATERRSPRALTVTPPPGKEAA